LIRWSPATGASEQEEPPLVKLAFQKIDQLVAAPDLFVLGEIDESAHRPQVTFPFVVSFSIKSRADIPF
jgi:hypothetical protein